MGSASAPHSWTNNARSWARSRALPLTKRAADKVTSPRKAKDSRLARASVIVATPRRSSQARRSAPRRTPVLSGTASASRSSRCMPSGNPLRSRGIPRSRQTSVTRARNVTTALSHARRSRVSKATARARPLASSRCTGSAEGKPVASSQAPARRMTTVSSLPRTMDILPRSATGPKEPFFATDVNPPGAGAALSRRARVCRAGVAPRRCAARASCVAAGAERPRTPTCDSAARGSLRGCAPAHDGGRRRAEGRPRP